MKAWFAVAAMSVVLAVSACAQSVPSDSDQKLAEDLWTWRARFGQFTSDDVNRMERPSGVERDWSVAGVEKQRKDLAAFEERWKKLADGKAAIAQQVDHRLMGSALARVHWEIDVLDRWQHDPRFYIEQTVTPVVEALTVPGPYDAAQSKEILWRLNQIPNILKQGQHNLESPPAVLASNAIDALADIRTKFHEMARSLGPHVKIAPEVLDRSADQAGAALEEYREWLKKRLPTLPQSTPLGREKYVWFLRNVALMPFTPEELVAKAEQEWRRAVAFESTEINRNRAVPPQVMAATTSDFIAKDHKAELGVRDFLEKRNVLTLRTGQRHFTLRAMPPYLGALGPEFAELDDFTSPSRLDQDGIRYVDPPSPTGGYFVIADAKDPRIQIVHEGTVGHYGQLCNSWQHSDPIRRHYYDSGANEGIGFYAEEMMLQAGLYDDSPHTREIVYNQMRLRALRVIADVKAALGEFSLKEAADFLQHNVPMSADGARYEAVEISESPGQKISYQIGKLQIVQMLSDARLKDGNAFDLRKFHDYVWLNGNVPIALQRWELLGNDGDVKKIDGEK